MTRLWCTQVLAIVRLEMRKTFFSRRGLWVYLLAFAPLLLFMGHVLLAPHQRQQLERIAREHPVSSEATAGRPARHDPGPGPGEARQALSWVARK